MTEFILILFLYAGPLSQGDSVALTNIPGFQSREACELAGKRAQSLTAGTIKSAKYVCVAAKQ